MKKIVLALIAAACITSCEVSHEPYTDEHGIVHENISNSPLDESIEKITIEGHEYLVFRSVVYAGRSISVIHSASCPANHENWNRP